MKIGILTQPLHLNYGGILQNWALQQVLIKMGHEPEMIFLCGGHRPQAKVLLMRCMSFGKCLIKKYLLGRKNVYLHSVFSPQYNPSAPQCADVKFVRCIRKTEQLGSDVNISKYVGKREYDAFVVGSDQVWREDYSPAILHYFLDFLPDSDKRPRIAYAASFGKSEDYISNEKMPLSCQLLHRFDAVSVREYGGLEILERDFDFHRGIKVLDPTLLLSSENYRKLIKLEDRLSASHVTAYILDSSKDKDAILSEVSSQLNLPSKIFTSRFTGGKMLTVSQWLAEFDGADFVVTDSFHGCVFSIIFQRPFVVIANQERGLNRFVSLLRDAGLENRLVFSYDEFCQRCSKLLEAIDYKQVEQRLDKLCHQSLMFLQKNLAERNYKY